MCCAASWTDEADLGESLHHANHFYGHAHILARYCGLDAQHPPRVQGYIQHGWNIGDGLAPGTPYHEHSPILVWSQRTRRRAWSLGRRNVVAIGAPWLYLLALLAQPDAGAQREGTIWYPFHGWEGQDVSGDHARLVETIQEVETGPVTICLYWTEYHRRRVRRRYERAGFRVICHGYRGHWWERTDREFLIRQAGELRAHRRVASNRLSSAIFYGVSVGCEPAVYGDPMVLHKEDASHGGFARIARQWPQLHGTTVDLPSAQAVTRAELGADAVLEPAQLRTVLGWPDPAQLP
jgi:hypothetical protein